MTSRNVQLPMLGEPPQTERPTSPPFVRPKTPRKQRPLGKSTPIVWLVELSFGCNLACAHCVAEQIKKSENVLMDEETWRRTFEIINEVSPFARIDLAGTVGEPTLNPRLLDFLRIARELAPNVQIQITTNGTRILAREYKMKDLLDAGANILYIDQYGAHGRFEKMAHESGYPWYQYYDDEADKTPGALTPWQYWGPDLKMIVLMDEPSTWPASRRRANILGSWLGTIDYKRAAAGGFPEIAPLREPLKRRCNQPFQYVTVSATGEYLLCCQDGLQKTRGQFGSVHSGVEGFREFWFGRDMQWIRGRLREKDRASVKECSKCSITFSRCDYKLWDDEALNRVWQDGQWVSLEPTLTSEESTEQGTLELSS